MIKHETSRSRSEMMMKMVKEIIFKSPLLESGDRPVVGAKIRGEAFFIFIGGHQLQCHLDS